MTIDAPANRHVDAAVIVENAAQAYLHQGTQRPNGTALTAALLNLEKTAKQTRLSLPQVSLLGTWRLCFSAGKKAKYQSGQPVGSGFYVPQWAIAQITFALDETQAVPLKISNELRIGPLKIGFTGPARYLGQKNLLAFDFTQLTVSGFGLSVYRGPVGRRQKTGESFAERPIAQLPFFAFFAATDRYVAARGRGGGIALWVKSQP